MHILLTNDDGITARGLRALAEGFTAAGHRVTVCAPDQERSGASHSIAIGRALRATPVEYPGAVRAWRVDGTPADCASLGIWLTRDDPPDLVVTGINRGMNMGGACVYSGTVAAAMEAAMCGAQGLAVSLALRDWNVVEDYAAAVRLAVRVADWAVKHPLPLGAIYNLNVPPLPYEEIRGLVPAKLAPMFLGAPVYEVNEDGSYRFKSNDTPPLPPDGDVALSNAGYATLTKLTWDFRMAADDGELGEIGM